MKEHPERFGPLGGARWRGAIYGDWQPAGHPVEGAIFHGPFGNGLFQGIYANLSRCWLDWISGVLWLALVLLALILRQPASALVITALSLSVAACRMRQLPAFPFVLGAGEKLLLLLLCWWQPVVREWARVRGMIRLHARPRCKPQLREVFVPTRPRKWSLPVGEMAFWSEQGIGRDALLKHLPAAIANQGQSVRVDDGWRLFDVEAKPEADVSTAVISATEYHGDQRCLTRVRISIRIHPTVVSLWLLVFVLTAHYLAMFPRALLVVVVLAAWGLFIRRRTKQAVVTAALEAGLTPCSGNSTPTARTA
jgi:hypothetical protein